MFVWRNYFPYAIPHEYIVMPNHDVATNVAVDTNVGAFNVGALHATPLPPSPYATPLPASTPAPPPTSPRKNEYMASMTIPPFGNAMIPFYGKKTVFILIKVI